MIIFKSLCASSCVELHLPSFVLSVSCDCRIALPVHNQRHLIWHFDRRGALCFVRFNCIGSLQKGSSSKSHNIAFTPPEATTLNDILSATTLDLSLAPVPPSFFWLCVQEEPMHMHHLDRSPLTWRNLWWHRLMWFRRRILDGTVFALNFWAFSVICWTVSPCLSMVSVDDCILCMKGKTTLPYPLHLASSPFSFC